MANQEHLDMLLQDIDAWNKWRVKNRDLSPDLSGADLIRARLSDTNLSRANLSNAYLYHASLYAANLSGANLSGADLTSANLTSADLGGANFSGANLGGAILAVAFINGANFSGANLSRAYFYGARLVTANFSGANLGGANLSGVDLSEANLSGANLAGANLNSTRLVKTDLSDAILTDCSIFGISAWGVKLDGTIQRNLVITDRDEPTITVDNLEVAQFIYLLLNYQRIRDVINSITSKAVLILGSFTEERKAVLDAIREELRIHNYLPILFDFEQPSNRNLTETVSTLAHMSRFVIADITDAKSIPQELQRIVPDLPSLPVQPLILASQDEYSMFKDFSDYPWVLTPYRYNNSADLLTSLEEKVIRPAVVKAKEIEERRKTLEKMTLGLL